MFTRMKCVLISVLLVDVRAAPFFNQPFMKQPMEQHSMELPLNQMMLNQRPVDQIVVGQPLSQQFMMNQMMQRQMMEQLIQQNQYNALQQQLIGMQQLPYNTLNGPMMPNLPQQPIILFIPNTITKAKDHLESLHEIDQPSTKLGSGDTDSVVIDAEDGARIPDAFRRRAMVVLPNGQRFFIGSIISAIPFLPFEVNVPDTIAWMYNGIAGVIGGIGQRLPFRPKPTENPGLTQKQMPVQTPQAIRLNLMEKLMDGKQNVEMPILMLPVAQAVPVRVPIEV